MAAVGVVLSAAFTLVSTDLGRELVVPRLVKLLDDALVGRIELGSVHLLAEGGIELRDVRVLDPDDEVVLELPRARANVDLGRLRSKAIGVRVELERPSVLLRREADGTLSIARAFSPTHPSEKSTPSEPFSWTVRVTSLKLWGGSVRSVEPDGLTSFEARELGVQARAVYGPRGGGVDLSLRGEMVAPERVPLALDVLAGLRDSAGRVRVLRAAAGDTSLDFVAQFDTKARTGRAALLAFAVDAGQVRGLMPGSPLAGDLAGTFYAESNGELATAALELAPRGGGSARASAASRLPKPAADGSLALPTAVGLALRVAGLDLSKVLRGGPATSITLDARARGSGSDLSTLRGRLELLLSPSRLRTGKVGRGEVVATADRGLVELERLSASLPGLEARGRGRWRQGGSISGQLRIESADLALARRNLEVLLARPLPVVGGAFQLDADVSGTESKPSAKVRLASERLELPGASISGLALEADAAGPSSSPSAALRGRAARLRAGAIEMEDAALAGSVRDRAADVSLTGVVPELSDRAELRVAGSLSPEGRLVHLTALTLGLPGDRFELQRPARIELEGPRVDLLALGAGAQRITVSGGFSGEGPRRRLDARATVERLELARLARLVGGPTLKLGGTVDLDARARGPASAPDVTGRLALSGGAIAGLEGLSATADLGVDGRRRRAEVVLAVTRSQGGSLGVRARVPTRGVKAGAAAPLAVEVDLREFPVPEALRLARVAPEAPVAGRLSLQTRLGGTVGAPTFDGRAALDGGSYGDVGDIAAQVQLSDPGDRARLVASVDQGGQRALDLDAQVPLRMADLVRDPSRTGQRLGAAPIAVVAAVPGFDLSRLAGHLNLRPDLRGVLTVRADVSGSARSPRGKVTGGLAGAAYAGYHDLAAQWVLSALADSTRVEVRTALAGDDLAIASASVALPVERLGSETAREAASLALRLDVPHADLRQAGAAVPLAGEVAGRVRLEGTLRAPRLDAELSGRRLEVNGHPLGELSATARAQGHLLDAVLHLAVATGGTLDGTLHAEADPSLPALRRGDVKRAPARAQVVAKDLDLAFLPAVAPGYVRSAEGKLVADVTASGPLARMIPRGTVKVVGGKAAIVEFGDWSGIDLDASVGQDAVHVDKLTARHGGGTVEFKGAVTGLGREDTPAALQADLTTRGLTLSRAGQDLATIDLAANLTGTVTAEELSTVITIPQARVKLPDRTPRNIQPLDERGDITVGPLGGKKGPAAVASAPAEERPYRVKVHLLVPNRFFVKADQPAIDIELKADVTAEKAGPEPALSGDVETLRGRVEPIGGRVFDVKRGRVHFTGDGYKAANLEIQALYDNPQAKVTVAIGGTIASPDIKLTSDPPMDESQIALLIATGRTDLKAGTGGVGSNLSAAQVAGNAALGAVTQQAFKDLLADKLPVDTVSLDPSQLRAGKYLTDKIYVGYTHRFDARLEERENTNEVRAEYQISPRWNFEVRYGDANTGGASLMWSKDY